MADIEIDLYLVDLETLTDRDSAGGAGRAAVGNPEFGRSDSAGGDQVGEGRLLGPGFRAPHRGVGVDKAEAVVGTVVQAAAVPVVGAVRLPSRTGGADLASRVGEDLLDVAIAQIGIRLEHQGDDTRHGRGCEGGATGRYVVAADIPGGARRIRRVDVDARGRDENGGAWHAGARDPAVVVDRGDSRAVDRILEVVEVDVVTGGPAVSSGKHKGGAEAVPAGGNAILQGGFGLCK